MNNNSVDGSESPAYNSVPAHKLFPLPRSTFQLAVGYETSPWYEYEVLNYDLLLESIKLHYMTYNKLQ